MNEAALESAPQTILQTYILLKSLIGLRDNSSDSSTLWNNSTSASLTNASYHGLDAHTGNDQDAIPSNTTSVIMIVSIVFGLLVICLSTFTQGIADLTVDGRCIQRFVVNLKSLQGPILKRKLSTCRMRGLQLSILIGAFFGICSHVMSTATFPLAGILCNILHALLTALCWFVSFQSMRVDFELPTITLTNMTYEHTVDSVIWNRSLLTLPKRYHPYWTLSWVLNGVTCLKVLAMTTAWMMSTEVLTDFRISIGVTLIGSSVAGFMLIPWIAGNVNYHPDDAPTSVIIPVDLQNDQASEADHNEETAPFWNHWNVESSFPLSNHQSRNVQEMAVIFGCRVCTSIVALDPKSSSYSSTYV
ncbi:hypothetical protein BV898_14763 [Hypsibius exemplaris]|uniref:Uncharacterized protein n=1 Tax=Hypsibius exemplaris TaxID=2072580 RepID=A0A9X6RJU7_HYPEX|nr:hypothetical protein BV898_14763 [Hypsibius exemplaris]